MATKSIRAVRLPSGGSLLITLIAQAVRLAEGVGIMNDRGRMIGWIAIPGPDDENRGAKFEMVLDIFNELINAPRNATQPNWGFLETEAP